MRVSLLVATAVALSVGSAAFAQEYVEYKSQQDRFSIVFPAQPKVTEKTYKSEFGSILPERDYAADTANGSHFSVRVVDYNNIRAIATEKAKACPAGAETCLGTPTDASSTGAGYWKPDIEGAVIHATWEFMQRDAKVVYLGWANMNLVEGHMINLVNNKDKSRTSAAIYMHENKLYVIEGTVPAGYPVPDFFQQSVGWLDENGNDIRYLTIYHNGFPKPEIARRGGAPAQGQGQAPGGRGQAN
jgi:hypothetical protein